MPVSPIARPLMAPSMAPNSMARAVPNPCDAEPNANPRAIGFLIRHLLSSHGPIMLPKTPQKNTTTVVNAGIPPECFDNDIAIGIVTDLGCSDDIPVYPYKFKQS